MSKHIDSGDKAMINMIMGNIHVGKSEMWVARYWLKRGRFLHIAKALRFEIARYGLKVHSENRGLYSYVMGGVK